jgi:hypothetical protein
MPAMHNATTPDSLHGIGDIPCGQNPSDAPAARIGED